MGAEGYGGPEQAGGGSGGDLTAYYWLGKADLANLPNGRDLSALANGSIIKVSVAAGVASPAAAVPGTDYVNPGGVAGGQTINGDTAAGGILILASTSNPTKGKVKIGPSAEFEATAADGNPTTAPMEVSVNNTSANLTWFFLQANGNKQGAIGGSGAGAGSGSLNVWGYTGIKFATGANVLAASITAQNSLLLGGGALATTATDGFPEIPGGSGPPTGVPTANAGFYPLYWDHTNKKLYIYDGGWLGGTAPGVWS